ncbi:MAG: lipoate--protein ligase family protein [Planctomycetota bacterium]
MSAPWRWIRSGPTAPALNMGLDEALLRSPGVRPTLRTYRWEPWTLSLGYFQHVGRDLVAPFLDGGRGLVRRPTGGGAIFHGDELTYAVVCPASEPAIPRDVVGAYRVLHSIVKRALAALGVSADLRGERTLLSDTGDPAELLCFHRSTAMDLATSDRKLVGSAQRRTGRGFLQHGSIPAGPNEVTPESACVGASPDEIEAALGAAFEETPGIALEPGEPTREEWSLAEHLAARRYANDAWTWRRARPAGC